MTRPLLLPAPMLGAQGLMRAPAPAAILQGRLVGGLASSRVRQDHAALSARKTAGKAASRLPRSRAGAAGSFQQPPFFSFFGAGAAAALPAGADAAAGAEAPGFAGSAFLSSAAKAEAPASARHAAMIETFNLVIARLHQEVNRRPLQAADKTRPGAMFDQRRWLAVDPNQRHAKKESRSPCRGVDWQLATSQSR
jgi:hypothetical protein